MKFHLDNPSLAGCSFLFACFVCPWYPSFSLSRQYQRRGLMFEAVSSVIDHLFHTEGADYIVCGHFDFNIPSRELLKKLGFSYLTTERFKQNGEERVGIETILWRK